MWRPEGPSNLRWPEERPGRSQGAPETTPRCATKPAGGCPRESRKAKTIDFLRFLKVFGVLAFSVFHRSKRGQEAPHIAQGRPNRPRKGPQDGPGGSPDNPRGPQKRPKRAPRATQEGPKSATLRGLRPWKPQEAPGSHQEAPKKPREAPKRTPGSPKRPPRGPQ